MVTETNYSTDELLRAVEAHECEIKALRRDLSRTIEFFAKTLKLPKHSGSCSNQNVLDPVGAYRNAAQCYCTQKNVAPVLYPLRTEGDITTLGKLSQLGSIRTFRYLNELVTAIEELFDCRDGAHAAHAIPDGAYDLSEPHRYRTLGIITTRTDDNYACAPQQLYSALYQDFLKLHQSALDPTAVVYKKPVLYWRYAQSERIEEGYDTQSPRVKLRTRVAIPQADWSKAQYVQADGEPFREI